MRRKQAAIMLGLVLGMSMLTGCGGTDDSATGNSESTSEALYGEVSEIGESSITIKVGTMQEREQGEMPENGEKPEQGEMPDKEGSSKQGETAETSEADEKEESSEASEAADKEDSLKQPSDNEQKDGNTTGEKKDKQMFQDGEQPSMLELTGEEQEIEITEDTVIKKQGMFGKSGGKMDGAPDKAGSSQEDKDNSGETSETAKTESTDGEDTNSEEAPEKPEGKVPSGEASDGEKPSGEMPGGGENGEKPSGEMPTEQEAEEIALEDIAEGDTVSITLDEDGKAAEITVMSFGGGMGQSGDMSQAGGVDSYEAVTEYTSDEEVEGESYTSTGTDENAIHVLSGATAVLKDITVSRTSSDSTGGDNSSFYGVGAAVLTTDGNTYISEGKIETDASGGAGVFAYDKGTVYIADTDIYTKQDTSGGIHAAGGGTLYAWDLDVETEGQSAAAIRSDRGGGTMVVDGGSYVSNGTDSPAIYSTADIAVNDAELRANGSEAICIEGLNSIHLYDSDLKGNMSDDSRNDCTWNVILYQSMSGDSEVGNSTFEMNGGTLKAENGGMFYTTNTESTITLSDVNITYADDSEFFLKCTGNNNERGWGTAGENGADCLFTAVKQDMEGDIIWDSISKLDFYMTEGSTLKGAVVDDETCAGENGDGYSNLYIGEGCTWTVTGDSTLSKLFCAGTITDEDGKTVTIKGNDGSTYVEGDSSYTITVDAYEETVDLSGASDTTTWEDYQVEKPEELK